MSWLTDLGAIDIREKLPTNHWQIGMRTHTTSITDHYNGPPVPLERQAGDGLIDQLIADSNWQMKKGWGSAPTGAPHLMYLAVFAADGTVYQTAHEDEILWHCAHQDGNAYGVAFHYPLGVGQYPTGDQIAQGIRYKDAARRIYNIARARCVGHLEWRHMTLCPGPLLMAHVHAYRTGIPSQIAPTPVPPRFRRFQITVERANVRQAPATKWNGQDVVIAGTLKRDDVIYVDVVKTNGEAIGPTHNRRWVHMALVPHEQGDLGFVSETLGVWV